MILLLLSNDLFFKGQGIKFFEEASSEYKGNYVQWMTESMCGRVNITVSTVTEFDLCLNNLIYERNEIVESVEHYFDHNSTLEPIAIQWLEFFNPSKIFF